ncbi:MAG TPA: tetratricopeptide repeat protein [Gallionella sp.]
MKLSQRFSHHALLLSGALFVCACQLAQADDLADANKLFRQGNHAQALEKTDAILTNKPRDAQARFLKGLILTEQNNTAGAIQIFTALTNDYPELPEPYNNLAVLYANQGNYDKAKIALEKAIRTHPSYSTAHENLGDIYAKLASQAYDRALQLDRSNPATQTKLAMIQELFAAKPARQDQLAVASLTPAQPKAATAPIPQPVEQPRLVAAPPANAPAGKAAAPAGDESNPPLDAVLKTVDAWAAAWSSQNVNGYLSFYSADFKPAGGESRKSWAATRRERISAPKSIRVTIGKPTVKFTDNTHAVVKFRQTYKASHLASSGNKTLLMVKAKDKWLIQEELSK